MLIMNDAKRLRDVSSGFRATGKTMDRNDVLARIAQEAQTYHLPAGTALRAYVDILVDLSDKLDHDDLEALIAIGTVLIRHAEPDTLDKSAQEPRLRLVLQRPC
jgi:hypothetical protein